MNKDKILETTKIVGKMTVRCVVATGVSIAVVGGGMLGTLWYAGISSKNKVIQGATIAMGLTGSVVTAQAAVTAVDRMLVEDYGLGVDM